MAQQRLKIIPEFLTVRRSILRADQDSTSPVVIKGSGGGIDLVCGKCGEVLAENIQQGQLRNLVLFCIKCQSYNDVP